MSKKTPFTEADKMRIQSKEAKKDDGRVAKQGFAAKVQHIVDSRKEDEAKK